MSERPATRPIERVVIPLDAASDHGAAIETAARLAARTQVPLHGIFVEDEDLLHLARLPFARQHTLLAAAEALTAEHVELHWRLAAERARRDLVAAAERHGVSATFEIVRGAAPSALARASDKDLVVAGAMTRPVGAHFRVECRWWPAVEAAPGPFLVTRHLAGAEGAIVLTLDERSAASARLLDAAVHIAVAADLPLTVIHPPEPADGKFEQWIVDRVADRPLRLQIEAAPSEPPPLRRRLGELDCLLIFG